MKKQNITVVLKEVSLVISSKQAIMLQMAANDVSRKDIASELGVSHRTVETYFDEVRRLLGKKSFAAALVELHRKKIIK